jgi:hypothetical protein
MIVFELECREAGHRFEGWFGSSEDFSRQQERGLVACPQCGGADVVKAPMAPRLTRKGNQLTAVPARVQGPVQAPAPAPSQAMNAPPELPPKVLAVMQAVAAVQAEALKSSRWVGERFAEDARAMHYGDKDHEPIHGQATAEEARALIDEGVEIAPILFPVAPPDEVN